MRALIGNRSIRLGVAALALAATMDTALAQSTSQRRSTYPAPTYNQNTFGNDWAKPRPNTGSFYNDPRQSPVYGQSRTPRCRAPLFYDTVSGGCR